MDYILDLWNSLGVCFKARLDFMSSIINQDDEVGRKASKAYSIFERESGDLGLFWRHTKDIYDLIGQKENKYGNFTHDEYETYETSE